METCVPLSPRAYIFSCIQNVAVPRRNGRIRKFFELIEPRFRRSMEHDCCIRVIFPYRDQNRILSP